MGLLNLMRFKLVQVPLYKNLSLRCANCTTHLSGICKLAEGGLNCTMSLKKILVLVPVQTPDGPPLLTTVLVCIVRVSDEHNLG